MQSMRLSEEEIVAGLSAPDFEGALAKLVAVLPDWRVGPDVKQHLLEALIRREKIGTTAIGGGIALPHCFSSEITEPMVVFGVSPDGIPYPSLDGRPVHFVFMLLLPQTESAERVKRSVLQNIKWVLCDRSLADRMKRSSSAHEIAQLLMPTVGEALTFSVL
jgi:PTS system nitrogen regulatory IIA component